jgi:hypothetical protein
MPGKSLRETESSDRKKILGPMQRCPMNQEKKSPEVSPKIVPLAGTLEYKRIKCGRANCKCARGELHGEYAYLRVQQNRRRSRRYVKKGDVPKVLAGLEAHRKQKAQKRAERQEFHNLLREMKQESQIIQTRIREYLKSRGIK